MLSIKRLHAIFIYYRIVVNTIAAISRSIGPCFLSANYVRIESEDLLLFQYYFRAFVIDLLRTS